MRLNDTDRSLLIEAITAVIDSSRVCEDGALIARLHSKTMSQEQFRQFMALTRDKNAYAIRKLLRAVGRCDEAEQVATEATMFAAALSPGDPGIFDLINDAVQRCERMPSAIDHLGDVVADD